MPAKRRPTAKRPEPPPLEYPAWQSQAKAQLEGRNSTEQGPIAKPRPPWVLASAAVIFSVTCCLLLAEIVLSFLPVASGLRSLEVDDHNPIFHFAPDRPFVFSAGWNLQHVNRGRVNNAGWVNDQDYRKDDPQPLVAVIGDSYIEAQIVPYQQTMQARLAESLAGEFRVYSFAAMGAPLSQYLIWARHAVRDYGAMAIIINVCVNDFDESHIDYRTAPGFWLYAPDANGELQLRLLPHRRGVLWRIAQQSALARYLLINLHLGHHILNVPILRHLFIARPAHAGASIFDSEAERARLRDSYAVIDAFFRDLPRLVELPRDRVLLTIGGLKYSEPAAADADAFFDLMRKALLEKAAAHGYEAVDLDPLFVERHHRTGQMFKYPYDPHWNGNGHAVAADAALSSRMLRKLRQQSEL
jgi:hypothetical protein